ncbi:hypothetical protein TSOC_004647 [Tetrabaena socialis]|uniref:Uncharacterized protein n=1 Tax=Tetrabaena socialis TaxID=47790 RepID=A0A2J8A8D0_9CHLO|nr:hypothetical protein TSOC_004647 [Tetrabaena socialis]|eukprot:PNH08760.1 hypothetical protein TSOC_004647 [Tetrabaena socialis]
MAPPTAGGDASQTGPSSDMEALGLAPGWSLAGCSSGAPPQLPSALPQRRQLLRHQRLQLLQRRGAPRQRPQRTLEDLQALFCGRQLRAQLAGLRFRRSGIQQRSVGPLRAEEAVLGVAPLRLQARLRGSESARTPLLRSSLLTLRSVSVSSLRDGCGRRSRRNTLPAPPPLWRGAAAAACSFSRPARPAGSAVFEAKDRAHRMQGHEAQRERLRPPGRKPFKRSVVDFRLRRSSRSCSCHLCFSAMCCAR